MPVIVLDTCEIHKAFYLDGPRLGALAAFAREFSNPLLLSEVVLEEHVADYATALTKEYAAASRFEQLRTLDRKAALPESIEAAAGRYRTFVLDWFSKCGRFYPIPEGSYSNLLKRLTDVRKPFKADRTGLADALLWHSIVRLAVEGENILFVSSNKSDFSDGTQLHPDLVADLIEAGVPGDRVTYFPGLQSFQDDHIRPTREQDASRKQLAKIGEAIEDESSDLINLSDWLSDNFNELMESFDFIGWDLGIPYEFEDSEFASFKTTRFIEDVSVSDGGGGHLLIQFDAHITLNFYASAAESEVYDSDFDVEILSQDDDYDFSMHSYRVTVKGALDCTAELALRIDPSSKEVIDAEVVDLKRD